MFLCHVACYDRFIQIIFYCLMHYCVTFGEDAASDLKDLGSVLRTSFITSGPVFIKPLRITLKNTAKN